MDIDALDHLIKVLDDGQAFYTEASGKVQRPDLKELFAQMAQTKSAIAKDLRRSVKDKGVRPPPDGSVAGAILKAYAEVRTRLSADKNYAYVSQLESFEDRIVSAFQTAATESSDVEVREVAQRHLPQVLHDLAHMRGVRESCAAA